MKKTTNYLRMLSGSICIVVLSVIVNAQTSGRADGMRFVPNVEEQFRALADQRADPLGFRIGGSPNPSSCRHYQAITRVNGADGTPFFLVTRSGNTPPTPGDNELNCFDSPGETRNGHLIVFRMGSRDKNGERLRSNRLLKGVHVNNTVAPVDDVATIYFTFVGGDPNAADPAERPGLVVGDGPPGMQLDRVYQHPGGMQLIGNVLAVALETPRPRPVICAIDPNHPSCSYDPADDPTLIMFFDVSNPETPRFLSQFAPRLPNGVAFQEAGVLAVTPLPVAPGESAGRYLMGITGGQGTNEHFFRSTIGNLASPDLSWEFVDTISPDVPDDAHQTLHFLRQGNIDGPLYLAGVRGHPLFGADNDFLDLYTFECETSYCAPGESLSQTVRIRARPFATFPNAGGDRLANGAAASGYYISPTGELILYATEHDNDGPNGTVKLGEWAHRDQARSGSPTYLPTARAFGPYSVDEGSTAILTGSAEPPITKAWFQFYHQTDFRSFSPMVDYADYDQDDFNDFFALEFLLIFRPPNQFVEFRHNDKARSWRWFAPVGCSIDTIDLSSGNLRIRTLIGTGGVVPEADLSNILSDAGLDAVDFQPNCDTYYNTPFLLRWDLDVNGSFETTGSPVTFNALRFDGPSVVNVPAQAVHPSGGQPGFATAVVTVRNVAPDISQFAIRDGAGNQLNVNVPFALTGLPLTLGANFADPGVLDHQTASINWGDGTTDGNTAFASFDQAFGDAVGSLTARHTYGIAGTYAISLTVSDDDGGADAESAIVRVLTPEQAVEEIIGLLDNLIAATTQSSVRENLNAARRSLAGNPPNGTNGALEKIRNGNTQAAIAHINQAIRRLEQAQQGGASAAALIALLEQVKAALSAA